MDSGIFLYSSVVQLVHEFREGVWGMRKEETVHVGFRMPIGIHNRISEIASERNVDKSVILKEAVTEYVRRNDNPDLVKDQIRQVLRDDPLIVAETVQIYAARKLEKK